MSSYARVSILHELPRTVDSTVPDFYQPEHIFDLKNSSMGIRGTQPTVLVRLINHGKLSTVQTTTKMTANEGNITIWNNQIRIYEHETATRQSR